MDRNDSDLDLVRVHFLDQIDFEKIVDVVAIVVAVDDHRELDESRNLIKMSLILIRQPIRNCESEAYLNGHIHHFHRSRDRHHGHQVHHGRHRPDLGRTNYTHLTF